MISDKKTSILDFTFTMSTISAISTESKISVRCWKSLYMKLTSVKVRYQDSNFESELSECSEHFKRGIFQFRSHVSNSHIELRENKNSTFMESFYHRLSRILNLDLDNCKEIFANYLLYNCNTAGALLQERLEKNIRDVLISTWTFYAQERIFFLKCYYHIITTSMEDDAPYSEVFRKFLSQISVRERYSSLLQQYSSSIHSELPSENTYGVLAEMLVPLWINFNLREQLELLYLIILVTSKIKITLSDIGQLVELLQVTSFGRYQCFFYHHSHLTANQISLQKKIHYAVTFYAIQILSCGWNKDIYEQESAKFAFHNKIMYPSKYDAKQGPIIMAWILVRYYRLKNTTIYDEELSNQAFILLDEDLWKLLDDALHSNIMDMTAICKVIEPVVDEMVYLMFSKFEINAFNSETTLASIVAFFCKFHTFPFNKSTNLVLTYFRRRFPLSCACTFKIYGAILNWCTDIEHRKEVMKSLNHFKYSLKKDECDLKTTELNKYVLKHDLMPLAYCPNVLIPRNTEIIPDFEECIITIQKELLVWDVMRNFLMMYLNGDEDDNLLIAVMEIINFVEISLQKIKTIDNDILRISELVVHIIWKTSCSYNSLEELNLLASCIKFHSVLFCIMPEDIIKCFEIYNFLPGYPVRMRRKDIQMYDTYYTQSRIYTIVCCKEAKIGVYSVLFSYLNFLHKVVQNTLESWYSVAGLKFVFYVYNNVNNDFWKFQNLDDRNLIIWNCIEIIHEILNHGLKDLYEKKDAADSLIDFRNVESENIIPTTYFITRTCVMSILNSVNETTVLSTAITGDLALLESVMECACWTKGKSAIFINVITYSLSLLQRCLIFADVEKKIKKTEILFDHLFQPEKCLALLSYRYNCFSDTICLLAIKLLVRLASMKENCMFSWLQYSNELLQKEFLYPLYSNNESNAVKSSLLSLMAVCILKQIVIADALLEIDKVRKICVEKSVPDAKWQNLLSFTSRYIHDLKKKKEIYSNNMHCAVLNVIYACWEKKLRVSQQYYKMSKDFWKCLWLPFNDDPNDTFNGYGFILETVCLEIVDSKDVDSDLMTVLNSFLNSDYFIKWTEFFSNVIDEPSKLSVEFESMSVSLSSMADSWKKFVRVVSRHCKELVNQPGATAFTIFDNLIQELSEAEFKKKEKFLCDIYRIYLATWEKDCSDSNWERELALTSKMFIVLDKYYQHYSAPYFFSALLEIGYKIYKFGRKQMNVLDDTKNKSDFLLACCGILNQNIRNFSKIILEGNQITSEYPPLLLHLCVFVDVLKSLQISDELIRFVVRETNFVNLVLKTNNELLNLGCGTKTVKMLLQFQDFIFDKYPFLKINFFYNDWILNIFQSVFPADTGRSNLDMQTMQNEVERKNLFRYGLNFISSLTNEQSCESKILLLDFISRNKQYLYIVLRLITTSLTKDDLCLTIATVTFYRRISEHLHLCTYNEVNDLMESMFLLFNCVKTAVSMLIQPSKMCALLFNVPVHHLQQFLEHDSDNMSTIYDEVNDTYTRLMHLVKIATQTLSVFCMNVENILCGTWPPEDWNYRWLNKIKTKSECLFPALLFDFDNVQEDFSILATYITLEYRAFTKRTIVEQPPSVKNLIENKLTIINYDASGEILSELSYFLFSQSAMYLLHPDVDQSQKLFFVNHIFMNLKEFMKNAINDFSAVKLADVPSAVSEFEVSTMKSSNNHRRILNDIRASGDRIDDDSCVENGAVNTLNIVNPAEELSATKLSVTDGGGATSTPKSAMQVRHLTNKRSLKVHFSEEVTIIDYEKIEDEQQKLLSVSLFIVAGLFFKLTTTFKHSL